VAYLPDLARLLAEGSRYDGADAAYVIEAHWLDPVVLPTGQIAACDPLTLGDIIEPFLATVAPGTYRLRAWVAVLHRNDDAQNEWQRRVAALELVVRDEPAERWEMALADGQSLDGLEDDEFYGYGVDAGTGTLADLAALQALAAWDYPRLEEAYIPAQLPDKPGPGAIAAVIDEATGANVVTVRSGWGDGAYPTFVGYSADGEVTSFVTDFAVVPAPDVDAIE
jgi:hypothetical protein